MQELDAFIGNLNGVLFSPYTVFALLFVGVLFTGWSIFGQYRALTHGVSVVRGKYDDHDDPGAINHFQALSTALSATVGLGNIAGVAIAVALGGPGAVLWMWIIGILGMAIKMTEVTQSMLYRNTDDPENPHGGPMYVVAKGLADSSGLRLFAGGLFALVTLGLTYLAVGVFETSVAWVPGGLLALLFVVLGLTGGNKLGMFIGGLFVVTLITSAITGGNMFQAWNVADITFTYFQVPQIVTGIILTLLVGAVIIGGIKRIGSVTGRIVPFMCIAYVLAALYVLVLNAGEIPSMLALIVKSGLPGGNPETGGAFLGGTVGYAFMWGVKRALFSSEAGQGSSPIAHAAAKTDEPVREGVVAGLEPFIDTIVVCTLTALVILSTGAYNRGPEVELNDSGLVEIAFASESAGQLGSIPLPTLDAEGFTLASIAAPDRVATADERKKAEKKKTALPDWKRGEAVFVYAEMSDGVRVPVAGKLVRSGDDAFTVEFSTIENPPGKEEFPTNATVSSLETVLYHGSKPAWTVNTPMLPSMVGESRRIRNPAENTSGWRDKELVFMVLRADAVHDTGRNLHRMNGEVKKIDAPEGASESAPDAWEVKWKTVESDIRPSFNEAEDGTKDLGVYGDYAGASLTAYAFDRVTPGLGKWLVTIAAWLFAVSTMISWSYYGEQGIYFFCGRLSEKTTGSIVFVYKIIYSLLILMTTALAMKILEEGDEKIAVISSSHELDTWTTLGLGVMLVANIPIMVIFGAKAMNAYHDYFKRMSHGGDDHHDAPPIVDVIEGKDVE